MTIFIFHPPCVLPSQEGKVSTASGTAQFCLWLSRSCPIWNFSSTHRNSGDPPTPPAGGTGKEHVAQRVRACVNCSGGGDANRMSLFVCEEEWKHEGCYFSLVHGLKYGDSTQSTKNILPDFRLRGTQLGQQTLELEHSFLLPKQSHTPKIHISCKYIGLIK